MKKVRKLWLGGMALAMVVAATCGIVAGCGRAKGKLTLEEGNGGTLSKTEYKVAEGTSLKDFLADKAPVPEEGLTFAGWYLNGSPMEDGATMSKDGVTLTAKYNATYTLNVYTMDVDGNYPETASVQTAESLYLEPLDLETAFALPEGFEFDATAEDVLSSDSLGKNATFNVHLSRKMVTVRFYANIEGDEEDQREIVTVRYGTKIEVRSGDIFRVPDTLLFAGWAASEEGEIVHRAGEEIELTSDLVLFALWDMGYTDRFGGEDILFLPRTEEGVALLVRAGLQLRGTADGTSANFVLTQEDTLKARLYADHTFAYEKTAAKGTYSYLDGYYSEEEGSPVHHDYTLELDGSGSAIVRKTAEDEGTQGGYRLVEDDIYEFMGDHPFKFTLHDYEEDGDAVSVFQICGEEAGEYYNFTLSSADGYGSVNASLMLRLDGFGGAQEVNPQVTTVPGGYVIATGKYVLRDIKDASGKVTGQEGYVFFEASGLNPAKSYTFRLIELTVGNGFIKKSYAEGEYSDGEGGTLTLDGYGAFAESVRYVDAEGKAHTGTYLTESSVLFGQVVRFVDLTADKEYLLGLTGEDSFEVLPGFTEYYQTDMRGTGFTYDPIILLTEEEVKDADGKTLGKRAELWSGNAPAVLVARGYYTEKGGIYTFTRTEVVDETKAASLFETAVFLTADANVRSSSHTIFHLLEKDGVAQNMARKWENADGSVLYYSSGPRGTTGVGAIYVPAEGEPVTGSAIIPMATGPYNQMVLTINRYIGSSYEGSLYFEVENQLGGGTFTLLDPGPISLKAFVKGQPEENDTFKTDGKGKAEYLYRGQWVEGTLVFSHETELGMKVYDFTPKGPDAPIDAFQCMITSVSSGFVSVNVYIPFDAAVNGVYESEKDGTLTLDGFGYYGDYVDGDGEHYIGQYARSSVIESMVQFVAVSGDIFFFDIKDGKTFTRRGPEFGITPYIFVDNFTATEYEVSLDGYGNANIYLRGNRETPVATATYRAEAGYTNRFVLSIPSNSGTVEVSIRLAEGTIDGVSDIYAVLQDVRGVLAFHDAEWNAIIFTGYGDGTYFDGLGKACALSVDRLSDTVCFITSEAYTGVVLLDLEKNTFTYGAGEALLGGYYGEDFSAVILEADGIGSYLGNDAFYYADSTSVHVFTPNKSGPHYYAEEVLSLEGKDLKDKNGRTFYHYQSGEIVLTAADSKTYTFTPEEGGVLDGAEVAVSDGTTYTLRISYTATGASLNLMQGQTRLYATATYQRDGTGTIALGRTVEVLYDYDYYYLANSPASSYGEIETWEEGGKLYASGFFNFLSDSEGHVLSFRGSGVRVGEGASQNFGDRFYVEISDGKLSYSISWYKTKSNSGEYDCYLLYLVTILSEMEAEGGYTAKIEQFVTTQINLKNVFGSDYTRGDLVFVDLYHEDELIVDDGFFFDPHNGFVALVSSENSAVGYLMRFTYNDSGLVKAMTVELCTHKYLSTADGAYRFAAFVDAEGNVLALLTFETKQADESYLELHITDCTVKEGVWRIVTDGEAESGSALEAGIYSVTFTGEAATVTKL